MNDKPGVNNAAVTRDGVSCEVRRGGVMTGLHGVLPWLLLALLTQDSRWLCTGMVSVVVCVCACREGLTVPALLQILMTVIFGYLLFFLLQPWYAGLVVVAGGVMAGVVWLSVRRPVCCPYRSMSLAVVLALYLACSGRESGLQGIEAVQGGLRLAPFLLAGGCWGTWTLMVRGLLYVPGPVMATSGGGPDRAPVQLMAGMALSIMLAGGVAEMFRMAHGHWVIWGAVCAQLWLRGGSRQKYAEGIACLLAGLPAGLLAGIIVRSCVPEHIPVLIAAVPAGVMLAMVIWHYPVGVAVQTALAVCGLSLAGESVLPRVSAVLTGVVVVVIILCLQKLLSGISLRAVFRDKRRGRSE
ncbi:hypothetical protein [Enterobacter hormaechei]|uniref:hypothetical protein n=1 Tax=Enterobacter hormaechei TaxID=158836 RepID=UPI0032DB9797